MVYSLCLLCPVPAHPSAEVNFALLRQFSVSLSLIIIPVVFDGLISNNCNPSYSGSRDQKNWGLNPVLANSSQTLSKKKPITKKGWWSGLRCRPWVQTTVPQKKNGPNPPQKDVFPALCACVCVFLPFFSLYISCIIPIHPFPWLKLWCQ
jgi:hypothetical protein